MAKKMFQNGKWLNLLGILVLFTALFVMGGNIPRVLAQEGDGSDSNPGGLTTEGPVRDIRSDLSMDTTSAWPSYWYTVIGATFTPYSSSLTYTYGSMGCVSAGDSGFWRASVNIPDKSVIKYIYFNYNNSASSTASTVTLTRYHYSGDFADLVSVTSRPGSTTGTGYFYDLSSEVTSAVNNLSYGYAFTWSGSTTQKLCSVQVGYYPPSIFGVAFPFIAR